jgi:hypothetical protein
MHPFRKYILQAINDLMPAFPPRGELRAAKANGFFQNVDRSRCRTAAANMLNQNTTLLTYSHARNTASSSPPYPTSNAQSSHSP